MLVYQKDFIALCIEYKCLRFGEFVLKSGRTSPYFFNAGLLCDGRALALMGVYYAQCIIDNHLQMDVLFGPAYKGIPLVSAVCVALWNRHQRNVPWSFNRKEAKKHGEGGQIVGAQLAGQVVLVDDVITAGTAIREAFGIIEAESSSGAKLSAAVIALDRQERVSADVNESAIQQIKREHGVTVHAIVTLTDVLEYLEVHGGAEFAKHIDAIVEYRKKYGVTE